MKNSDIEMFEINDLQNVQHVSNTFTQYIAKDNGNDLCDLYSDINIDSWCRIDY